MFWDGAKYIYGGETHKNQSPIEDDYGHFYLPDLRGKFMRGWNHGAGSDPDAGSRSSQAVGGATGDNVGSVQNDAFQGHHHDIKRSGAENEGAFNTNSYFSRSASGAGYGAFITDSVNTVAIGNPRNGDHGSVKYGFETRPKNVNVMYIIKY